MQESYSEDLASHTGPELYADDGNVVGVACMGSDLGHGVRPCYLFMAEERGHKSGRD